MTSVGSATTTAPAVRGLRTLVRPLVAHASWQATFHTVAGIFLSAAVGGVFTLLGLLWVAAALSLLTGPSGHPVLIGIYLGATVTGPFAILLWVRFASALQRERFRNLLEVEIVAPAEAPLAGWRRLTHPWAQAATWRQLSYHVLASVLAGPAGVLVVVCWSAPILAALWTDHLPAGERVASFAMSGGLLLSAPWIARGMAAADAFAGRHLLGPGPSEELRQRVATLARSRAELVTAADTERRRIERDLHDGVQQRLVSLAVNLGMAREAFADASPEIREVLAAAHDEATQALAELRDFVRGLHPAVLNDRGLDAALSGIVARAPLPVALRVEVTTRCSPTIEAIAYFTVSEALANVSKHARASRAEVVVEQIGGNLLITVSDNGDGGASVEEGGGLRGLAQRAAAVDGTFSVVSPLGGPTTVTVNLPCE
ncbi:sensor histidine kinase [Virgisporangium ochraceum]|uniref:sensor histidine kinase n=1 Tax=Virgisporangium ochraceum TaxID=65505 RepID=UPI00194335BE|nr:sensor histidine kinase [Virgisporangium ochraceum]